VRGSLPTLLSDGTRNYVFGLGSGPIYSVDTGTGVGQVNHADGLGSVRAITNGSGTHIQTERTV
jgi:hypothetical protein